MKKALSLLLALVMALSLTVTALAADGDKSGTTPLTAIKETPFSYEIVIPTDVAAITAAGVYRVGQAKVESVVSATDKTVISYTAATTAFRCEGKSDLPATYYTEEAAENVFPTDAVTVYENKADAESIPTMWVKIAEDAWNAAADGTYTATVTYNFTFTAMPATMLISNILATAEGGFPTANDDSAWVNDSGAKCWGTPEAMRFIKLSFEKDDKSWDIATGGKRGMATLQDGNYVNVDKNLTYTFVMDNGKLTEITLYNSDDVNSTLNGTYKAPVPVTVADLLATVAGFPTTQWQNSNWLNDKVIACLYKTGNNLTAYSNDKTATVSTSTVLTPNGNNYTYSDGTNTWSFIMEGETLTQITYSGTDDTAVLNGTYKILTVADLLATVEGFPTTYAGSKWRNNNSSHLYKDGDVLKAYNQGQSQTVTVPCNTVLTMDANFGDAYGGQYNEATWGTDWLFYMNDNKLTKVKYQYASPNTLYLMGDYAALQPK